MNLLSYGTTTEDTLLRELADEAKRYLELLRKLESVPAGEERDNLEGELYGAIAHLASHSSQLQEHLEILADDEVRA
jgi:hypothetical protein